MNPDQTLSQLLRARRSVRDFKPDAVPQSLLDAILDDASQSPSWSNTQPYRIAVATGETRDRLAGELTARFDAGMRALEGGRMGKLKAWLSGEGMPDGDFRIDFAYPDDLTPARRACGFGLYKVLGIERNDKAARTRQMRRNYEFFGAPVALFFFVHGGLREFSVLDAGIVVQTVMLSAQARGLATCAEGALAQWAGPVRAAFDVPKDYKLICGMALGYASDHAVNAFNPGRIEARQLLLPARSQA
ncbi:MAG TPA: nitroreductase [Usitatibacteraceae bacterium]|nr:nitroreductase [Usitatibacteraceae bacterium]